MGQHALRFILGLGALAAAVAMTTCTSEDTTGSTAGPCPKGICGGTTTGGSTTDGTSTGSGAGGTSTSSTTSSTSGGVCAAGVMACASPADCPDPGTDCRIRTCDGGCCGTTNAADLTPTASGQTAKDCQSQVCDGMGGIKSIADDSDKPDDQDACHAGACNAGVPGQTPKAADTPCAFNGGKVCSAAGACVECNASAQCAVAGDICQSNACVAATCGNAVLDGSETDIDCGGSACNGCGTGKKCGTSSDCLDLVCNATSKTCDPPSCNDGVKNGNETATDCGGACSAMGKACAVGQGCGVNADCTSGFCQGNVCALKPLGAPCTSGSQCVAPGACVDGNCCDSACSGTCRACTAALKGAGVNGACGNVILGNDPGNECAASSMTSCGTTGVCDGMGACQKFPAATVCAPPTCAGGTLTAQSTCDGNGTCVPGATMSCGSGGCNATGDACNNPACVESWLCTPWDTGTGTPGTSNAATRVCVDTNNCGTMTSKPATTATLPALNVAYFECNVEPILDKKCSMLGCHGTETGRALRVYAKARLRLATAMITSTSCPMAPPSTGAACTASNSCPCNGAHTLAEWQRNYDAARGFALDMQGNVLANMDQSDLIQQPIVGGKSHAAVHLFKPTDPEHATILNWLNGAPLPDNSCIGNN